jgi:hypothetical protein
MTPEAVEKDLDQNRLAYSFATVTSNLLNSESEKILLLYSNISALVPARNDVALGANIVQ